MLLLIEGLISKGMESSVKDDELIRSLRAMYKAKLPEKMAEIEAEWKALSSTWENEKFKKFLHRIHKFCGSSGSYGYPEISAATRELEVYIKELLPANRSLLEHETNRLQELIQAIKALVEATITGKNMR
jgi:HPt (histidine-containing phosphotransfer) domain-containing protein